MINISEKKPHNTVPNSFKDFGILKGYNKAILVKRKRFEYLIEGIVISLDKNTSIISFFRNLEKLNSIDENKVSDEKIKKIIINSKELYNILDFNYSTLKLFLENLYFSPLK